jgi:protein dithiol oxidoreductase (disulfide-forming)
MQRRRFSSVLAGCSAMAAAGVAMPGWVHAQAAGFKEGSDYRKLGKPAPVDASPGQVEVVEFFAYTCVHCNNFVPIFKEWAKGLPSHVVVRRSPVGFNPSFEPLQRLYFALEALNKIDTHHERVFKAIHQDRQRLTTAEAIAQWAESNGLNRTEFTQAYNSFGVAGKVRKANQLQDAYEVEATPSLGIGGRFYVPGQAARTVVIANALIAEARKA